MSSVDLAEFVIRRIASLRLTRTEVAKRAGFSRETLNKILRGDVRHPATPTLLQLAHAIDVAPLYLLRLAYGGSSIPIHTSARAKYKKDYSSFVTDVTYPDNDIVTINQEFEKIWEIQNTGEQAWQDRFLECVDKDVIHRLQDQPARDMLPPGMLVPAQTKVPIPFTAPSATVQIAIRFRAPAYPCTAVSYWKMVDAVGGLCFPGLRGVWCCVKVMSL